MRSWPYPAALAALVLGVVGCGDDDAPATVDAASGPDDAVAARPDDDGGSGDRPPGGAPTTYFIVRHTERDPGEDPPVNAEGEVRAVALADRLESEGIDEIITTSFIRGQQSGQPLADRLGQSITVAPATWVSWPSFADEVSAWQREREVAGRTYLMIGHSGGYNTTLLRGLGATVAAPTGEGYEDLVIVIREPDGSVNVTEELYGGPSSLDP